MTLSNYSRFTSESRFTAWLRDEIVATGGRVTALVGSAMQGSGVPDRYVMSLQWHGWLELKKDERQLTTAQKLFVQTALVRRTPAICCRCCSDEDVLRVEYPLPGQGLRMATCGAMPMWGADRGRARALLELLRAGCDAAYAAYEGE